MRQAFALCFILLAVGLSPAAHAAKVFVTKYESQAKYTAYEVKYESQANCKVYKVKYES